MSVVIVVLLVLIVLLLWGVCGLLWRVLQHLELTNQGLIELGGCLGKIKAAIDSK